MKICSYVSNITVPINKIKCINNLLNSLFIMGYNIRNTTIV